jgi:hypothetical protein
MMLPILLRYEGCRSAGCRQSSASRRHFRRQAFAITAAPFRCVTLRRLICFRRRHAGHVIKYTGRRHAVRYTQALPGFRDAEAFRRQAGWP